jgi:FKBP-type peptidyl-prolyl cis-trans isomerase 2
MATRVMPLHYVTVQFRLHGENEDNRAMETSGQCRFLYGVETWLEGVDQQLESLSEGDSLELVLEPEAASLVLFQLLHQDQFRRVEQRLALELKIVEVVKAEPREVTKTLAAQVKCCDHCGSH